MTNDSWLIDSLQYFYFYPFQIFNRFTAQQRTRRNMLSKWSCPHQVSAGSRNHPESRMSCVLPWKSQSKSSQSVNSQWPMTCQWLTDSIVMVCSWGPMRKRHRWSCFCWWNAIDPFECCFSTSFATSLGPDWSTECHCWIGPDSWLCFSWLWLWLMTTTL